MQPSAKSRVRGGSGVYAVIPVFNRVEATLSCIDCLKRQTHANLKIVVVDGGSSDGTAEIVPQLHPDVTLLKNGHTLWWGGATALGIEHVLAAEPSDRDYVLMVNNDTRFAPDFVKCLVETSRRHKAVAGCVVVSADDPDEVIDGGITLDWTRYRFHTVKAIPARRRFKRDCDVLPGRGALVPVWAIRQIGSVDGRRFPHYLADYEFTHRLKRVGGVPLVVDYRARAETRLNPPMPAGHNMALRDVWNQSFSRRSKSNVIDHLLFVRRHGPAPYRRGIVRRIVLARARVIGRAVVDAIWRGVAPFRRAAAGLGHAVRHYVTVPLYAGWNGAVAAGRAAIDKLGTVGRGIAAIAPAPSLRRAMPARPSDTALPNGARRTPPVRRRLRLPSARLRQWRSSIRSLPRRLIAAMLLGPAMRLRRMARKVFGPYLVCEDDCRAEGLSLSELRSRGIVQESSGYRGYFYFAVGADDVRRGPPGLRRLYRRACLPGFKMRRYLAVHRGFGPLAPSSSRGH